MEGATDWYVQYTIPCRRRVCHHVERGFLWYAYLSPTAYYPACHSYSFERNNSKKWGCDRYIKQNRNISSQDPDTCNKTPSTIHFSTTSCSKFLYVYYPLFFNKSDVKIITESTGSMHCKIQECIQSFFYREVTTAFICIIAVCNCAWRHENSSKAVECNKKRKQTVRREEKIFFCLVNFCNDIFDMALPIHDAVLNTADIQSSVSLPQLATSILLHGDAGDTNFMNLVLLRTKGFFHIAASTRVHRKSSFCFVMLWTSSSWPSCTQREFISALKYSKVKPPHIQRRECIDLLILNLETGWRCEVSFTPRPFYSWNTPWSS